MHVSTSTKLFHAIIIGVCDYSPPDSLLASLLWLVIELAWTTDKFNEPRDLHFSQNLYNDSLHKINYN